MVSILEHLSGIKYNIIYIFSNRIALDLSFSLSLSRRLHTNQTRVWRISCSRCKLRNFHTNHRHSRLRCLRRLRTHKTIENTFIFIRPCPFAFSFSSVCSIGLRKINTRGSDAKRTRIHTQKPTKIPYPEIQMRIFHFPNENWLYFYANQM